MEYGVILPQGWRLDLVGFADAAAAYEAMTQVARDAEALGYHAIWLYDHMHTFPQVTQEITFECWTALAALARDTTRIRIGQIVTCNSYRNPALLAKMASTLDVLSHGRLYFGIGAGWYEHEYRAYGYPYPDALERLRQLHEALQVILAMWTQDEATFEGKYYQIRGAINQPKGVQKPRIPILIGGGGEKVTLKLAAKYADACNVGGGNAELIRHKLAILKQHCEAVGRDYNSIRRTTTIDYCALAETDEAAIAKLTPEQRANLDELRHTQLIGTPEAVRERLAAIEEAGIQETLIRFVDTHERESLHLFAREFLA
jgi:F420-dependent oxidoreductase-like protein